MQPPTQKQTPTPPALSCATHQNKYQVKSTTGAVYTGKFAVVTVPLGILKANKISFKPGLPSAKKSAIKRLGMGTLNKVVLEFPSSAAWDNVNWIDRIPLASDKGRWREFFSLRKVTGKPIIVAFNAGAAAQYKASVSDATLVGQAVAALRGIYGAAAIPDPVNSWVTRWHTNPYTLGSYSTVRPGATGTERADLYAPVTKLLYFAGEAASTKWPSTVQGAFETGKDAAALAASEDV